ncbi:MAG: PASTA domain-containing protein [Proteobacteria bacterium]|nr:PASTA domain-containing protein [Pseudomonadota bacterium]
MTATHVNPGDPLSAEAWNDLVDTVNGIPAAVEAAIPEEYALEVVITNPGLDLTEVRVTAVKVDQAPVEGVQPTAEGEHHVIGGLKPGAYLVRATAPGYSTAEAPATIIAGDNAPLEMALNATGVVVPNVFGRTFAQAKSDMTAKGLSVTTLRDFTGKDYVPTNPGAAAEGQPVLVQSPAAGAIAPNGSGVNLVIAVEAVQDSIAEVPSLIGMTLSKATSELSKQGLAVGEIIILDENPTS